MTNQEIILRESIRLMNDGIIAGSGRYVTMTDNSGAEMTIELPEAIHTFSAWKKAGFAVKRGEHAIACFPVWKYTQRRNNADNDGDGDGAADGDSEPSGHMYMRKAFWFKLSQVEKITA